MQMTRGLGNAIPVSGSSPSSVRGLDCDRYLIFKADSLQVPRCKYPYGAFIVPIYSQLFNNPRSLFLAIGYACPTCADGYPGEFRMHSREGGSFDTFDAMKYYRNLNGSGPPIKTFQSGNPANWKGRVFRQGNKHASVTYIDITPVAITYHLFKYMFPTARSSGLGASTPQRATDSILSLYAQLEELVIFATQIINLEQALEPLVFSGRYRRTAA